MALAQESEAVAPLDPDALIVEAQAQTGYTDFGPDLSFMTGFRELVKAVEAMDPPPQLRATARANITKILSMRLRMAEDDRNHPEIAAQDVGSPLIVCGLPRTGTTITYDLLCLDPAARAPTEWEWYIPWPPPEKATFHADPRIAQVQAIYENWLAHAPQLADIQRMDCTQPGECNHGMMMHFASTNFPAELGVPDFAKWLLGTVAEGQYVTHKRLLQQFQWKGPQGRWTLKSPQHLFDLPGLVEAYPGAMLVWTHRDPVLTFSSLSSMIAAFLAAVGADKDLKAVGRSVFETWSEGLERGLKARDARPDIAERIIDLGHSEVVADPTGSIRRIYDRFGLPFTPEHQDRITQFLAQSSAAKRLGRHKHSAAQFGIDPDEVRERLASYYARFGHLLAPLPTNTG
ncbi:sulfotransferase [Novosphingobium sp. CCH12-A3]|uniref:sulfotransferase family protein n=1 Tax=Novosphingobium sp. CCH12-A3 TaxID=1768752 RepID=UPI00078451C2|nr:sulfotransferase [Novosphingobium sp. CCH12-A3]